MVLKKVIEGVVFVDEFMEVRLTCNDDVERFKEVLEVVFKVLGLDKNGIGNILRGQSLPEIESCNYLGKEHNLEEFKKVVVESLQGNFTGPTKECVGENGIWCDDEEVLNLLKMAAENKRKLLGLILL